MNWFEKLTGFSETHYRDTVRNLVLEGRQLRSLVNGRCYGAGELELAALQSLRDRAGRAHDAERRLRISIVNGDVRKMHGAPEYSRALFQVASQFNLLEMAHYSITPEQGVGCYEADKTQGPACAMAAGAATIFRNYFVPVGDGIGQTRERQLDALADVGQALSLALSVPRDALWTMRNGYVLATQSALEAIGGYLNSMSHAARESLKGQLRIGVHREVEVTDLPQGGQRVSQAFCSALPVGYNAVASAHWAPFARLVLEAAYEATLCAGVLNAAQGGSNIVLLTRLGGGAFGNEPEWIDDAIRATVTKALSHDLDVRLVSFGPTPETLQRLVDELQA